MNKYYYFRKELEKIAELEAAKNAVGNTVNKTVSGFKGLGAAAKIGGNVLKRGLGPGISIYTGFSSRNTIRKAPLVQL